MASTINAKNTSTGVVITPDASGQLELQTADTTRMTITSSGNVGVGTSSPQGKLDVTGTGDTVALVTTNTSGNPRFGMLVNGVVYNWIQANRSDYSMQFAIGNTERMRIDSSGNVGIGTSSPSARLNVTGTSVVANIESTNNNNVMGILFNGSIGGYIGASASTLQFSNSSGTGVAAINSTNFQFNSGYGSVATAYGCRAWVNFNGTGTVAIRASGNVTSITDNGTGDYTVNFTTAMPDTNYTISGGGRFAQFANADLPCIGFFRNTANPILTTSARIGVANLGGGAEDPPVATVTFHR